MIDVRLQAMKTIAKAFVSRGNGMRDTQPDLLIPSRDASWPAYASVNSAVVTSPDGDSVAWLRRDSKLYRQQTMRGLFLAKELLKRWESLAKEYQNSDMASFERGPRFSRIRRTSCSSGARHEAPVHCYR